VFSRHLHIFAANVFRKLRTKFNRNRPSVIGDITKYILVTFFPDTLYILLLTTRSPC